MPKSNDEQREAFEAWIIKTTVMTVEKSDRGYLARRVQWAWEAWQAATVYAVRRVEMTPEEADAAYDDAPAIPMSEDEIERIVAIVTKPVIEEPDNNLYFEGATLYPGEWFIQNKPGEWVHTVIERPMTVRQAGGVAACRTKPMFCLPDDAVKEVPK